MIPKRSRILDSLGVATAWIANDDSAITTGVPEIDRAIRYEIRPGETVFATGDGSRRLLSRIVSINLAKGYTAMYLGDDALESYTVFTELCVDWYNRLYGTNAPDGFPNDRWSYYNRKTSLEPPQPSSGHQHDILVLDKLVGPESISVIAPSIMLCEDKPSVHFFHPFIEIQVLKRVNVEYSDGQRLSDTIFGLNLTRNALGRGLESVTTSVSDRPSRGGTHAISYDPV